MGEFGRFLIGARIISGISSAYRVWQKPCISRQQPSGDALGGARDGPHKRRIRAAVGLIYEKHTSLGAPLGRRELKPKTTPLKSGGLAAGGVRSRGALQARAAY